MNIIEAPKIYLISDNRLRYDSLQQFLQDEGVSELWQPDALNREPQTVVEVAGRTCYMSFAKPRPGGNAAYIQHILEVGHGSVLEHAVFSLLITGVSRSLTHELIRHRAGMSYSQLSQRFVDEGDCDFVAPPAIVNDQYAMNLFRDDCKMKLRIYRRFVEYLEQESTETDKTARRKKVREAARSVLPNCTATKIVVTGNARAWRHFIELRGSEHADAEIRRLAVAVLGVLCNAAPNLFGDYTIENGAVTTPFRKV